MALIFFEGFNSPSGADPAYWSFVDGAAGFTAAAIPYYYTEAYKNNPRAYIGGYQPGGNENTAGATLTLPTAHSGKTVYIGCGMREIQEPNSYNFGIGAEASHLSQLFIIKNNASTHVISIAFAPRPDWSAAAPDTNLGIVLTITQTVDAVVTTDNFRIPAEFMLLVPAGSGIVIPGSQRNDRCHYFEFKLDFLNAQFAVRYNDQLLGLHADTDVKYTTLAVTEMQKLVLRGRSHAVYSPYYNYPNDNPSFQDLYIADDTGSGVVAWLGADTYVVQPPQSAPDTAEWFMRGTTDGNAVVNSADGDTTYVYTRALNANQTYTQNPGTLWPTDITNIAAVKVSSVARCGPIPSAIKHVYENSGNVITPMSAALPLTAVYKMRSTQLEQNPNTSAAWTKADISAGSFGVQSTAAS